MDDVSQGGVLYSDGTPQPRRQVLTMSKESPITILIVDDHEVVRLGLQSVFKLVPEIKIVGEADSMGSAVTEAVRLQPDVVLLDIRLPDRSGVDACREILEACPTTKVLFLTSYADDNTILSAILSGAQGYVLKEIGSDSLIRAIQSVAEGQSLLHPQITQQTMALLKNLADPENKSPVESLSQQEHRVIKLVAQGNTNKEIAAFLRLSEKTVKNYLSKIYEKLQVTRRSQAAVLYTRHQP